MSTVFAAASGPCPPATTLPITEHAGLDGIVPDPSLDDRTQVEGALRESQRALATLMDNLPGMAYRCRNDPDWTMDFVSRGALDLTGYTSAQLVGNADVSYGQLIRVDDRGAVLQ